LPFYLLLNTNTIGLLEWSSLTSTFPSNLCPKWPKSAYSVLKMLYADWPFWTQIWWQHRMLDCSILNMCECKTGVSCSDQINQSTKAFNLIRSCINICYFFCLFSWIWIQCFHESGSSGFDFWSCLIWLDWWCVR
jgi:hypothetical protein